MRSRLPWIALAIVLASCAHPQPKLERHPPIYVSFDADGRRFFGPLLAGNPLSYPFAGGKPEIAVVCEKVFASHARLVFREQNAKGETVREARREVPFDSDSHFRIFDSIEVCVTHRL